MFTSRIPQTHNTIWRKTVRIFPILRTFLLNIITNMHYRVCNIKESLRYNWRSKIRSGGKLRNILSWKTHFFYKNGIKARTATNKRLSYLFRCEGNQPMEPRCSIRRQDSSHKPREESRNMKSSSWLNECHYHISFFSGFSTIVM